MFSALTRRTEQRLVAASFNLFLMWKSGCEKHPVEKYLYASLQEADVKTSRTQPPSLRAPQTAIRRQILIGLTAVSCEHCETERANVSLLQKEMQREKCEDLGRKKKGSWLWFHRANVDGGM